MERDNINSSTKENQQNPAKRKLRISTLIIWAIFFVVVVLCFLMDSHSQRLSNEIIRLLVADKLNKKDSDLTKADYLNVTELDLSGTAVSDLRLLKKFHNLQTLDLTKNPVEIYKYTPKWRILLARWGILKSAKNRKKIDLSPLKNLKKLQTLNLSDASFKNLKSLSNLKNLRKLILDDTSSKNLKSISHLTNLEELDLQHAETSNIKWLWGLTNLRKLNLSFLNTFDIEPLKNLTNLKELSLNYSQVSNIEPLRNLKNLEILNLCETQVLNLDALRDLDNLRTLNIWNTPVSDLKPLKNLTKLQMLNIYYCTNITTEQIEDLKKALPELKIYH